MENRRSKDDKMSVTMEQVVEAEAGEVRIAETEGRREERERETRREITEKEEIKKNLKKREQ